MKKPSLISVLVVALAAAAPLAGCLVDVPEEPTAAKPGGGGGGGGQSCDDFDSYCDAAHPCDEGFVCAFDAGNCGSNYFGTFPDCGVTATCYPACQPKQ